jgi:hypothetical protein
MKTNLLFILISCIWSFTSAQNKHDYYWTVGHGSTEITHPDFGGTDIDFNKNPPTLTRISREMITLELVSSSFCDKEGDLLLFYTDGCYVMDTGIMN